MSEKPAIILAGLPGDMATRVLRRIQASDDYELATAEFCGAFALARGGTMLRVALTGTHTKGGGKGEEITPNYIETYLAREGIRLVRPEDRLILLSDAKKLHGNNLYGINFATFEGFPVNFNFVDHKIPFISGVTGVPKESKSGLVSAVQESGIPAVVDVNMHPALVVLGSMFRYGAETFPGALEGYGGLGIESHQDYKSDPVSGTLNAWAEFWRVMGVDFSVRDGARNIPAGHGDHYMTIRSPSVDTRVGITTEVTGRDSYAQGAVEKALPFLINEAENRRKADWRGEGTVYTMEDVLRGQE